MQYKHYTVYASKGNCLKGSTPQNRGRTHTGPVNSKEQNSSFSQITWKSIGIGDLGLKAHLDPVPDTVREGEVVSHGFGALFLDV